jgi:hypothetical protein
MMRADRSAAGLELNSGPSGTEVTDGVAHRKATRHVPRARLLTARLRATPDFVLVGGQKCGTTSLYHYLAQHPQVLAATIKGIHYFSGNFAKGLSWYRAHFPLLAEVYLRSRLSSKPVLTGEASPYYLFHPHAPRRLAQVSPVARLIVLVRDPVERAYSHYAHNVARGKRQREPLTFKEAIEREGDRVRGEMEKMLADEWYDSYAIQHYTYAARGIYMDQLMAYETCFSRRQILVIRSEDLFTNTVAAYQDVLAFLGLDPFVPMDLKVRNAGQYPAGRRNANAALAGTFEELREFFKPHNQRLYEYLGRDLGW